MISEPSKLPENLDHLVYTASSLDVGMDEIEKILGVRPVPGGRHPGFGTHNALLSLGSTTYLEIIAPDPETLLPNDEILLQEYFEQMPRLSRWVVRTEQIEELTSRAAQGGLSLGEVQSGSREKPDGSTLSWKLTDPRVNPIDGTVPFLISWGDTAHPAASLPSGGELVGFRIEHPNPEKVKEHMVLIGVTVDMVKSEKLRLVAKIKTVKGTIELF